MAASLPPLNVARSKAFRDSNDEAAAADRHSRAAHLTTSLASFVAGDGRRCWAARLVAWNRLCLSSKAFPWSTGSIDEVGTRSLGISHGEGVGVAGVRGTGCGCWTVRGD